MSGLRCRAGDLAVVVRPMIPENQGKLVTVLKYLGHMEAGARFTGPDGTEERRVTAPGPTWWVEAQTGLIVPYGFGHVVTQKCCHAADWQLRPIRDQDGEDESLRWAPVPSKEVA